MRRERVTTNNYNTIKVLQYTAPFDCDLVDLSLPMLEKARERISSTSAKLLFSKKSSPAI
jgi:hypothetical protein